MGYKNREPSYKELKIQNQVPTEIKNRMLKEKI
jgi:hypothetical protein